MFYIIWLTTYSPTVLSDSNDDIEKLVCSLSGGCTSEVSVPCTMLPQFQLHMQNYKLPHVVRLATRAVSCSASRMALANRVACCYVHQPTMSVFGQGLHCLNYIGISRYSSDKAIRVAYISSVRNNMSKEWRMLAWSRLDHKSLSMTMNNCIVFARCALLLDVAVAAYLHDVRHILLAGRLRHYIPSASECLPIVVPKVVADGRPCCEGGGLKYISHQAISNYMKTEQNDAVIGNTYRYLYMNHFVFNDNNPSFPEVPKGHIRLCIPLSAICEQISVKELRALSKMHVLNVKNILCMTKSSLVALFSDHNCGLCSSAYTVLKVCPILGKPGPKVATSGSTDQPELPIQFPPPPLNYRGTHSILTSACNAMLPENFVEAGCCVCAQLIPMKQMSDSRHLKRFMSILEVPGITRSERTSSEQAIADILGPVIDASTPYICLKCRASIQEGKIPRTVLVQGLWLGEVPEVLSRLSFAERILIVKVHHNCCFVKVSLAKVGYPELGSRKMISHVISFDALVAKVYDILPLPRSEIDEVLAVLFTGPERPTEEDMKQTPLLVRHLNVLESLQRLCLNYPDYADVTISMDNLREYADNSAPVDIIYQHSLTNKAVEGTSINNNEVADGISNGSCPMVVHGLIGDELSALPLQTQKVHAARHFKANHGVLAVGHEEQPESIYNNPHLYPSMFPWLFPYSLGGIGTTDLSDAEHKKWLLMYHDKRFQTDPSFPFVTFSHKQIKSSTTGGFLLAKKDKFHEITDHIMRIDEHTLTSISERLKEGIHVVPQMDKERDCFQLLNDLDHVAYKVSGSLTSKKYM